MSINYDLWYECGRVNNLFNKPYLIVICYYDYYYCSSIHTYFIPIIYNNLSRYF